VSGNIFYSFWQEWRWLCRILLVNSFPYILKNLLINKPTSMHIKVNKDLYVFHLETTGTMLAKDRNSGKSLSKWCILMGIRESKTWLVNREMEIPAEVSWYPCYISNEKVQMNPPFNHGCPKKFSKLWQGLWFGMVIIDRAALICRCLADRNAYGPNLTFDMKNAFFCGCQTNFSIKMKKDFGRAIKFIAI